MNIRWEEEKQEAIKAIKKILTVEPDWASDVMLEVAVFLKQYETSVQERRDNQALNAIAYLFSEYPHQRKVKAIREHHYQLLRIAFEYYAPNGPSKGDCGTVHRTWKYYQELKTEFSKENE